MILIIGGRYQGRHEFARNTFTGYRIADFDRIYREADFPHGFTDTVMIADENSSGIVPDDPDTLMFREEYNAALLRAAASADEVYRVFCGIGMKIK